jgi:hypothetical protein
MKLAAAVLRQGDDRFRRTRRSNRRAAKELRTFGPRGDPQAQAKNLLSDSDQIPLCVEMTLCASIGSGRFIRSPRQRAKELKWG